MKIIAGITLLSILGIIGIVLYIIYIIWEYTDWIESCSSSPIISFKKFRTLYEIDKSKWELCSDYPIFRNDSYYKRVGLSFRDYLKYKKYCRYLNKKQDTIDAASKQKDFENALDKYLESKISEIQNDLRKNTEELKQRTEDYKSDFECINKDWYKIFEESLKGEGEMKVTVNGKEYECQEIKIKTDAGEIVVNSDIDKKKTGYERVNKKNEYCFVMADNNVVTAVDYYDSTDNAIYKGANYYSSEEIAKNNARADKLMRQLRRFSVENRKNDINWTSNKECGYRIVYNHQESIIEISCSFIVENFGTIYFDSQELAKRAIREFNDELIWYFTEYKDSL